MWWKLAGLVAVTAALVLIVIPIRSRVVMTDPAIDPPPPPPTMLDLFSSMYLTPAAVLIIMFILGAAAFAAWKIIQRQW